ncbi:MAG TPA: VanZ family protein [Clostridiales bacterium]|nr:VanZ family protein [Clostridiales bacterium]
MYLENNSRRRQLTAAILSWLPVLVWMALIFFLSGQNGNESGRLSRWVTVGLIRLLRLAETNERIAIWQSVIRTCAHGASFYILAILVSWALTRSKVQDIRNMILALLISIIYAATDEMHQALVPGRASQWIDLLVDGAGILLAILTYQAISLWRYHRAGKKLASKHTLW